MRRLPLLLLVSLLFIACFKAPPQAFRMRDPIPVGSCTVTVTGSDAMSYGNDTFLTIQFRLGCGTNRPDMMQFVRDVRFSLRDSADKKYKAFAAPGVKPGTDPATMFAALRKRAQDPQEMLTNMGMDLEHWEIMVAVPASAHGFILYLENRHPASGQAERATVEIGR